MRSRSDPLSPSSLARCNLNNLSPSKKVDPKLRSSVRRLAKVENHRVFSQELASVTMDGSYGSIAALGQARWFVVKIKAYTVDVDSLKDDGNHLNLCWLGIDLDGAVDGRVERNWKGGIEYFYLRAVSGFGT